MLGFGLCNGLGSGGRREGLKALLGKVLLEQAEDIRFIFHDQDRVGGVVIHVTALPFACAA